MNRRSFAASLVALPMLALAGLPKPVDAKPAVWRRVGFRRLRATDTVISFAGEFHGLSRLALRAANQSVWIGSITFEDRQGRRWKQPVARNLPPGATLELAGSVDEIATATIALAYFPFPGMPAEVTLWGMPRAH